jgi:hypothetical protein
MLILMICLLIATLMVIPETGHAASRPVFKPDLDQGNVESVKRSLKEVLELSEAELVALVPEQSGFRFVDCPNCEGGAEENQLAWRIDRPNEVYCQFCEMRFPNEKFPENGKMEVTNALGETQKYPYWEAPFPPPMALSSALAELSTDTGYRHYFRGKGWFVAREYLSNAALQLAQLYHLTGDEKYAHRSALIIDRFAQVYPGYCARYDHPFRAKVVFPGDRTFPYPVSPYLAAKWGYWAYGDIPYNMVFAYDLIRESGVVDEDAAQRIEDDLFHASVKFVRSYPITLSNMDPTILRGLISAGRVLEEPAYVHESVVWISDLIHKQLFVDGMWREGAVSYHNQTIIGLHGVMELLDGYSDPEGYRHPKTGERLDDLRLGEAFPLFVKAMKIKELLKYPNGRTVALHDTWAWQAEDPLDTSIPFLLPGVGHAVMARGQGDHQMQAHFHFSGAYGHAHADLLSITLFAHGQERLSDIGYSWTHQRQWASSTLSHSTVMVNGKEQTRGNLRDPSDGNLTLYVRGDDNFQIVEADGVRAYPDEVREYRRLLMLVGVSEEDAYLIDLFHVKGGERHEYILVGDANNDGSIISTIDQTSVASLLPTGVKVVFPSGETVPGHAEGHNFHYGYVADLKSAEAPEVWQVDLLSEGEPQAVVRVHGQSRLDGSLLFGRSPSVRRAEESEGRLKDYKMPTLIHRREGDNLESTFVNVLEPFSGEPIIESVERIESEPGQVVLKISRGDAVDHIAITSEGAILEVGDFTLHGRIGLVRERAGRVEAMTLVGGTLLKKGKRQVSGGGVISGKVIDVMRKGGGDDVDGLVVDVDMAVSSGDALEGLTVIVKDGAGFSLGCLIAGVTEIDGQTVLVLQDDPGFEMTAEGKSRHVYFPGREWEGTNWFEIANVVRRSF